MPGSRSQTMSVIRRLQLVSWSITTVALLAQDDSFSGSIRAVNRVRETLRLAAALQLQFDSVSTDDEIKLFSKRNSLNLRWTLIIHLGLPDRFVSQRSFFPPLDARLPMPAQLDREGLLLLKQLESVQIDPGLVPYFMREPAMPNY